MANTYARPRARLIYPETLDSAQIRELAKEPLHLLIWYTLYHALDDQGRMEARVSTIQASCLRHLPDGAVKERVIQQALHRMRTIKDDDGIPLIYTYPTSEDYPASGTLVLQMAKWWEYQQGMKNAWPSRWPKPPASIAPTWTDQIIGYGKKVYQRMIESGEISNEDWGHSGANSGDTDSPNVDENIPVKYKYKNKRVSNDTLTAKPFTLLAAYLEERALPVKEFPGMKYQLREAKSMLADGFTPDEVRDAVRAFSTDPYWSNNGFDLGAIHRNWAKIKLSQAAKPKRAERKSILETAQ